MTLQQITGGHIDALAISPLGFAVLRGMYDADLLRRISAAADELELSASKRFLNLRMLRGARRQIPEIGELIESRQRLDHLSQVAEAMLEPYPIDVAASHVNYYRAGEATIDFHSDGAAMVELIPLNAVSGATVGTLVYRGTRDEGYSRLLTSDTGAEVAHSTLRIPHRFGDSILLQGRRLLHAGEQSTQDRKLLVIAMRSSEEPWKDDNTIARLGMDYDPEDFLDQWVGDELGRKLAALKHARGRDKA